MPRRHGAALLAQDWLAVPNHVVHVHDVAQQMHVMILGDTLISELAPRHLRVVLGLSLVCYYCVATAPDVEESIICHCCHGT